ncbi:50S ribosomal protein L28 [Deinococcus rubellus]|uniref:50S ribosomal protein L28 n=1 Tax=Deinococcus rubellus TaxID=1889240 RepID=UPI0031EA1DC6
MSRICTVTGKKNKVVNSVTRRGKARAAGGVGRKVTGVSKRVQKVNLQKKRVVVGGEVQVVRLSVKALRSLSAGKIKGMALV